MGKHTAKFLRKCKEVLKMDKHTIDLKTYQKNTMGGFQYLAILIYILGKMNS